MSWLWVHLSIVLNISYLWCIQAAENVGELDAVALIVEECGGLEKLEALQHHENETVYQKTASMIDRYFSGAVSYNRFPSSLWSYSIQHIVIC